MDPRPASDTALMVTAYRARATARRAPICHDPWAARLAGARGLELADALDATQRHMELWIALRTAHLDHLVRRFLRDGAIRQVVILGAGMDTRAARLATDGVRFFEVDAPAAQARKRQAVANLNDYPLAATTWASCDFEHEDFLDRLVAEGFDAAKPALFLLEGVVCYLTEAAVRATLGRISTATARGSYVAFDVLTRRMVERQRIGRSQELVAMIDGIGEPFQFGTNDALPLLAELGFGFVRTVRFDELGLMYGAGYDRSREFRFQNIVIAGHLVPDTL